MSKAIAVDDFASRYFSGSELYGDDFGPEQIAAWFADEENGYFDLLQADSGGVRGEYGYEALNRLHAFGRLPPGRHYEHALGFGSNYGDELLPILGLCGRITLLDASKKFEVQQLSGVPVDYLLAQASGDIDLPDGRIDLITCFGVLHHIPNVSKVLREFHRVLVTGAVALIREPTTTMGDWRKPRRGLTARERGLPRELFVRMVEDAGFNVKYAGDCFFPPWNKILQKAGLPAFGHPTSVWVDAVMARAFRFNYRYHRGSIWSRFGPASLFLIAEKPVA